jgi:hypothetical protein
LLETAEGYLAHVEEGLGTKNLVADAMLELTGLVRSGGAAAVSDAVAEITGRPARTFAAWCAEHAAAFR